MFQDNNLKKHQLTNWLIYSLQDKDNYVASRSIEYMGERLFKDNSKALLYIEILITLINLTQDEKKNYVQPIRSHYFARNVDNIWICSSGKCSAVAEEFRDPKRKFGKLYSKPINRCSCGAKVYEAIVCRQCGEIFLSGYENDDREPNKCFLENNKPLLSNIEISPTILFKRTPGQEPFDEDTPNKRHWLSSKFDYISGQLTIDRMENDFYKYESKNSKAPFPERCPACDWQIKYDEEEQTSTPLYRHGTGVQKLDQVFADSLVKILREHNEKSKLILFSMIEPESF